MGGRPIGQIALQGRKYGVGLLVVTQRLSARRSYAATPLLTHSLINQASLNFLESVYSSQHTRLIPNLGRFEFLAFGKALRAEWPVLLKRPFDPAKKAASDALRRPLEPQQAMPPSCKTPAPRPNRPRQTALTLRSLESSSAAS